MMKIIFFSFVNPHAYFYLSLVPQDFLLFIVMLQIWVFLLSYLIFPILSDLLWLYRFYPLFSLHLYHFIFLSPSPFLSPILSLSLSLSLFLSFSFPFPFSCLSLLSPYPSLFPAPSPSLFISISLFILFLSLSLSLSVLLPYLFPFLFPSLFLFLCLCLYLYPFLFLYLSLSLFPSPSPSPLLSLSPFLLLFTFNLSNCFHPMNHYLHHLFNLFTSSYKFFTPLHYCFQTFSYLYFCVSFQLIFLINPQLLLYYQTTSL